MATETLADWSSPAVQARLSISARAGEVFADHEKALRWLKAPNPSLCGRSPLDAAGTPEGCLEVEDILGRIEYGIIS